MDGAEIASKIVSGAGKLEDFFANQGEKSILRSNGPINKAFDFVAGTVANSSKDIKDVGVLGAINGIANKKGVGDAIKTAYMNADGSGINLGAVLGTYVGLSAAGRVLSGGGLYRDAQGNVNLPVIPFF